MNDLDLDALEHFPGGNLVVADFQHVAAEGFRIAVVGRFGETGERALVLFRFSLFFGTHFAFTFDNHAIGGLLERKFGNDLGGVAHHGQKFGARNVIFAVFPCKREHDEQQKNHHQQNDKVLATVGRGRFRLTHKFLLYVHLQDTNFRAASTLSNSQIKTVEPFLTIERLR